MGKIFRRKRPEQPFPWTGERLVTDLTGPIESEHLHRYFLARELCRGKSVLDVASGEGYGSALLAQTAADVVGVELDPAAVQHAAQAYGMPTLTYRQGNATQLPLAAQSVDVVVSFETLEHLEQQELFWAEIRRVLRPGGLVVISTPDVDVYSAENSSPNPYHANELTANDFYAEISRVFAHVNVYRQRVVAGSALFPDSSGAGEPVVFEQRDTDIFEVHHRLPRAPYLVAVASDAELPPMRASFYVAQNVMPALMSEVESELQRLRQLEQSVRDNAAQEEGTAAEAARLRHELQESVAARVALENENARLTKTINSQAQAVSLADAAWRNEAASFTESLKQVLGAVQDSSATAQHFSNLVAERDAALTRAQTVTGQLNSTTSTVRYQALLVQRLQAELAVARSVPKPTPSAPPEPAPPAPPPVEIPNLEPLQREIARLSSELATSKADLRKLDANSTLR